MPCSPPEDLPNPRIKPVFPASPAGKLKANSLPTEPSGKSHVPFRSCAVHTPCDGGSSRTAYSWIPTYQLVSPSCIPLPWKTSALSPSHPLEFCGLKYWPFLLTLQTSSQHTSESKFSVMIEASVETINRYFFFHQLYNIWCFSQHRTAYDLLCCLSP